MPPDRQSEDKRHQQMDEMVETVGPDPQHGRGRLDVTKSREHPGVQMVEQVAVEGPEARIVGVKGHHHASARRHQHCVAHRPGEALAVDLDDLEFMPMQMHRMRHRRLVDQYELDTLSVG
jgi:hypothetical protein